VTYTKNFSQHLVFLLRVIFESTLKISSSLLILKKPRPMEMALPRRSSCQAVVAAASKCKSIATGGTEGANSLLPPWHPHRRCRGSALVPDRFTGGGSQRTRGSASP